MKKIFITLLLSFNVFMLLAQKVIPLYNDSIPNSKPGPDKEWQDTSDHILIIHEVSRPTLTIYLPEKNIATGTAVVICPGGGYGIVAAGHEGYDVAKAFMKKGIAAFVLKYRIPNDDIMVNKEIGPLQDAQRAVQIVKEHAKEWHINPHKIGIMGFSAGGHLAASEGTHYEKVLIPNTKKTSLRPDFMILAYPVISFEDSIGHLGSRDNLIGKNAAKEKIEYYSNELRVNSKTPPSFLMHAKDDDVVKVGNSIYFSNALKAHHIKNELFLYEKGGHGFGMHNPTSEEKWMDKVFNWLKKLGF